MYLYKLEVELKDQTVYITTLAENDAQAFDYLEEQLVRHFVSTPEVVEASIIEKKRAVKGAGYVIETKQQ
ncbi:DUF3906 family protein [Paenibacillus sp. UNC451MF]|uniref:DUF3906 family protein n=1 Tax=Paenibacillus sp. UNC451MF TaxID=1449063 RepID=UPI000491ED6B|nr:DUF3906 family protein [Paenibacillus sp. UNC451MF]